MDAVVRLLVFHRNCLFRECLAQILSDEESLRAQPVNHAVIKKGNVLADFPADVILVDLNLPDNLATRLIQDVVDEDPHVKIVLLVPDEHGNLVECIAAGAHGCVLERSTLEELRPAIERVLRGETFCSTDIVQSMFSQISQLARGGQWRQDVPAAKLTAREQEVLELMDQRLSNKQIARRLSVSLYTVKNHVHNILEKLQVESRLDAVETARGRNWLHAR